MFKPREKWFRGSIFFSLKSLLVRRGESWLADRGQRRPCSGNPGKGISMVSWNSSSLNNSSFPEGQETRFEREEKRRKPLLRRARTWYSYTQTLFLGERCSSLHPPCHQGWAYALTVHHVLKTKRLKISDIQVLPCLKKRSVQARRGTRDVMFFCWN